MFHTDNSPNSGVRFAIFSGGASTVHALHVSPIINHKLFMISLRPIFAGRDRDDGVLFGKPQATATVMFMYNYMQIGYIHM